LALVSNALLKPITAFCLSLTHSFIHSCLFYSLVQVDYFSLYFSINLLYTLFLGYKLIHSDEQKTFE